MRQIAFNGEVYTCPFSEAFRRHSEEEQLAMWESVSEVGVQVPIRVYHDATTGTPNCILDGEGRLSAAVATDLGAERVPFLDEGKLTTAEAYAKAKTFNDVRRHDDIEAIRRRRERVAAARESGKSFRMIADDEGVSEGTVRKDIAAVNCVPGTQLKTPEKVMGRDGKERPATRPEPEPEPDEDSPSAAAEIKEDIKKYRELVAALVKARTLFDEFLRRRSGKFIREAALYTIQGDVPLFAMVQADVREGGGRKFKKMWRCPQLEIVLAAARRNRPTGVCVACRGKGTNCRACRFSGFIPADDSILKAKSQQDLEYMKPDRAAPWEGDE